MGCNASAGSGVVTGIVVGGGVDELVKYSVTLVKLQFSKQSVVFVELQYRLQSAVQFVRLQFQDEPFGVSIIVSASSFL